MPRYRVTAPSAVFEHAPGEEFEADIPDVQAERLLAGGHLELVGGSPATPSTPAPAEAPDKD